ncbi:hypothetical protein [Terrihabitans sp. B22-R8]|uniref:hypothetical protein n=1 Tax=Terrihabitans sp. B22-R8 TaxID=3425128 RepID=UPI00403D2DE7
MNAVPARAAKRQSLMVNRCTKRKPVSGSKRNFTASRDRCEAVRIDVRRPFATYRRPGPAFYGVEHGGIADGGKGQAEAQAGSDYGNEDEVENKAQETIRCQEGLGLMMPFVFS